MKIVAISLLGALAAIVVACSSSSDVPSSAAGGGSGNGGNGGSTGNGGSAGSVALGQGGEAGAACFHCFEAILLMKPPEDVCAESTDVYKKFTDCTCTGKCMTPCSGTCASANVQPSIDCQTCLFQTGDQGCGDEYARCSADK